MEICDTYRIASFILGPLLAISIGFTSLDFRRTPPPRFMAKTLNPELPALSFETDDFSSQLQPAPKNEEFDREDAGAIDSLRIPRVLFAHFGCAPAKGKAALSKSQAEEGPETAQQCVVASKSRAQASDVIVF
jgi:hypothetical protein